MLDSKKTKLVLLLSVCVAGMVLLVLMLSTSMAVSLNVFDNGGCISVAFDKSSMKKVDRIVIRADEKRYEITDPVVISMIVSETMVATNTDLRYPNTDRWIDVYSGNTLVRSMRWADNHDTIVVYNRDSIHWIYPSMEGAGLVYPSTDLVALLNSVLTPE